MLRQIKIHYLRSSLFIIALNYINIAIGANMNNMMRPCTNIYNVATSNIGVTGDPNWDDQILTYGINDKAKNQKKLRKIYVIAPQQQITICNNFAFDFNIINQYMTGILVGDPDNIDNDAMALTLGINAANASVNVTDVFNYSLKYTYQDKSGVTIRTNTLYIKYL